MQKCVMLYLIWALLASFAGAQDGKCKATTSPKAGRTYSKQLTKAFPHPYGMAHPELILVFTAVRIIMTAETSRTRASRVLSLEGTTSIISDRFALCQI